jgi:four helix bundle protein
MGRLQEAFIERIERFTDRVLDVCDALERQRRSPRLIDQIVSAGTSVGANTSEADEALSRKEFCRCLGIAKRELAEAHYWLRLIVRRKWIDESRLDGLIEESQEIKRVMSAMILNTRRNDEAVG